MGAAESHPYRPAHVGKKNFKGIVFRDIQPLFLDARAFAAVLEAASRHVAPMAPHKLVALEARGYLLAGPLADRLGLGVVPAAKAGSLRPPICTETYSKYYGQDELAVPCCFAGRQRAVLVDDFLSTGGTSAAAARAATRAGAHIVGAMYLHELPHLGGRHRLRCELGQEGRIVSLSHSNAHNVLHVAPVLRAQATADAPLSPARDLADSVHPDTDLVPFLADGQCWRRMGDALSAAVATYELDCVVGGEGLGLLLGAAVAARLSKGFAMARLPGKLPPRVVAGTSHGVQREVCTALVGRRVVVVDDCITDGTAQRATLVALRNAGAQAQRVVCLRQWSVGAPIRRILETPVTCAGGTLT